MTEDPDGETLLVDLKELHALERSAGERLSSMIALEPGAQLSELLEWQRVRTEWHEDALRARLEESGEAPSTLKGLGALARSGLEGLQDMARDDLARSACELYAGHHKLLAAYSCSSWPPSASTTRRQRAWRDAIAASRRRWPPRWPPGGSPSRRPPAPGENRLDASTFSS